MGDQSSLSKPREKTWAGALFLIVAGQLPEWAGKPLVAGFEDKANAAGAWINGIFRGRAERRAKLLGDELDATGATVDPESEVDATAIREAIRSIHEALDDAAMPPLGRLFGEALASKKFTGFQRSVGRVLCDLAADEIVALGELLSALVDLAPAGAIRVVMSSTPNGAAAYFRGPVEHDADLPAEHYHRLHTLLLANAVFYPANVLTDDTLSGAYCDMVTIRRLRDVVRPRSSTPLGASP